jgi:hypothetical protein
VTLAKVLVSIVYAPVLGAFYLYGQFDWNPPLGRDFWYGTGPGASIVIAAALVVRFSVGRWYVIGLALAPVFAAIPPQLQGKIGDFHDAYPPLENPYLWLIDVPGLALLLALGVTLRKALQRLRSPPRADHG